MYRKKAGEAFEAMQFDGSFESAKAIFAWAEGMYDAEGAYWCSNQRMEILRASDGHSCYQAGDWVVKRPGGLYQISAGAFADFEPVA